VKLKSTFAALASSIAAMSLSVNPAQAVTYTTIVNDWNGYCAGAGGSTLQGAAAIQWNCNGKSDEEWYFGLTTDHTGNAAEVITNKYSDLCIGVGSSLSNGAKAMQYTCNGAIDEKWYRIEEWPGVYQWKNVYSGKCLGTGSSMTAGTNLIQYTCDAGQDQYWISS
jgi:Ricin-type beta-trefoil lectin domain